MKAQNGKTARFEVSMANAGRGELDVVISGEIKFTIQISTQNELSYL